ncbi:MAG: type II secretion system protein [Candidatus Paceibacterota bacterium]|jgi:prepilin-type N-terminal cleavage/methylation domain-containing protein
MYIFTYQNKEKRQGTHRIGGFTLVEMIVSLGIFSVVAVVALGALVRIITANQKAQSLQSAMTNLNFALEAMSREIRVGSEYNCWNDETNKTYTPGSGNQIILPGNGNLAFQYCPVNNIAVATPSNTSVITFKSSRSDTTVSPPCNLITSYRFINIGTASAPDIHLQKLEQDRCNPPAPIVPNGGQNPYLDVLSASNVRITDYRMAVTNNSSYPTVFIRLVGYAGDAEKEKTYFDIQTTVSSRIPQL